jgi:polar amino acid transport system permease protein
MFDWGYAWRVLPDLLHGLVVTVEVTLMASAIALVLGLLMMAGRRSVAPVGWVVALVIDFIRSTPLLVQLYFLFFVLPDWGVLLSPMLTGVLGIGIHYAAYMSEVYRAGIASVPAGQWEAAESLHLSRVITWRFVVLPQAVRTVVPVLGNYVIAMFKDSALLSAIGVIELMATAKDLGAKSFQYLEPISAAGLLYLCVSLIASVFVLQIERRLATPGS